MLFFVIPFRPFLLANDCQDCLTLSAVSNCSLCFSRNFAFFFLFFSRFLAKSSASLSTRLAPPAVVWPPLDAGFSSSSPLPRPELFPLPWPDNAEWGALPLCCETRLLSSDRRSSALLLADERSLFGWLTSSESSSSSWISNSSNSSLRSDFNSSFSGFLANSASTTSNWAR